MIDKIMRIIKWEKKVAESCKDESYKAGAMDMANLIRDDIKKYCGTTWIPVSDRLPEDIVNPITRDAYVYPVTVDLGGITDIRYYSFCRGHWYNQGPKKMDELVIAWQARPEPYRPD